VGILAGIFSLLDPGNAGSNSMMPSSGAAGPSSSNPGPRLDIDLNLPPADAKEPETPEEEDQIELKIEQALLEDGYSGESLLNLRHEIRGLFFS